MFTRGARSSADLRAWHWLGLIALAWGGVLGIRATEFGGRWEPISLSTSFLILAWLACYCIGYAASLLGRGPRRTGALAAAGVHCIDAWISRLGWVAATGSILIAYEFAVVRGYGFTTPVAMIRIAEVDAFASGSGGSAISGAGRLMVPALLPAWILAARMPVPLWSRARLPLWAATATVLLQQYIFEGGRFFVAILLLSVLVARSVPKQQASKRRQPRGRRRWITAALVVAAIAAFGAGFLSRVAQVELQVDTAYSLFSASFPIEVSPDQIGRLSESHAPLWFVAYMFWMYVTQGLNQLDTVINLPAFSHAFGLVQFQQVGQILSKLLAQDIRYDLFEHVPNPGTYTTAVGMAYMDFGAVGACASAAAIGWLTGHCTRRLLRGQLTAAALAAPLLLCIGLFSPVVSLVVNIWPAAAWAFVVGRILDIDRRQFPHRHAHRLRGSSGVLMRPNNSLSPRTQSMNPNPALPSAGAGA